MADILSNIFFITERLVLDTLDPSQADMVLDYYLENRDFFSRYMSTLPGKFFTMEYQVSYLWTEFNLRAKDKAIRFFLFRRDAGEPNRIIGDINISHLVLEEEKSCKISYKLARQETGKGYMTEALTRVVDYIFNYLHLDRIEANIMPSNKPSIDLVLRLGFVYEGIIKNYLEINGRKEDHARYALIRK